MRAIGRLLQCVCLALLLVGCAHGGVGERAGDVDAKPAAKTAIDFSCSVDADCAIKDVGNCCGTYPACVNADSPTFPEQVKAQCEKDGMSSVCGFPSLSGCQCVQGRCEGVTGMNATPLPRKD